MLDSLKELGLFLILGFATNIMTDFWLRPALGTVLPGLMMEIIENSGFAVGLALPGYFHHQRAKEKDSLKED